LKEESFFIKNIFKFISNSQNFAKGRAILKEINEKIKLKNASVIMRKESGISKILEKNTELGKNPNIFKTIGKVKI